MVKTITEVKTEDLFVNMFQIPIYENKICFIRYTTDSGYDQALVFSEQIGLDVSEYKSDGYRNAYGFTVMERIKSGWVIFLFINKSKDYSEDYINTLSHENFHVIQNIMNHNGLETYKDSDNEHVAYLTGYLFEILYKL